MFPRFLTSESAEPDFNRDFDEGADEFDLRAQGVEDELVCGERICPSHAAPRGNSWLQSWLVVVSIMAAGWAWMQLPSTLTAPAAAAIASATSAVMAQFANGTSPPSGGSEGGGDSAQAEPTSAPLPPALENGQELAAAPGADAGVQVESNPEALPQEQDQSGVAAPDQEQKTEAVENAGVEMERLPEPKVDPSDRYAARALAVGLHPDLSRALLKKLTSADFENARKAIAAALSETPQDGTYIWPRKAEASRAQFEVRFVAGAPKDCRRYVVTVIKDRWSTTARAMEKCMGTVRG
ncbi:MAG: hypothetical protein KDJ17_06715 [Hyphomicrobiaceae bacterium]|nr:hypothetical protein [Hyphomicrobiaceae bacterium]